MTPDLDLTLLSCSCSESNSESDSSFMHCLHHSGAQVEIVSGQSRKVSDLRPQAQNLLPRQHALRLASGPLGTGPSGSSGNTLFVFSAV